MRPVESGVEQVVFPVESVLQTRADRWSRDRLRLTFLCSPPWRNRPRQARAGQSEQRSVSAVLAMKCPMLEFPQGALCGACGRSARRSIGWTAGVVHHVGAGVLVASHVGFDHVPAEQRELFVEARISIQVGAVEVGEAAVAEPNVRVDQRKPIFIRIANAVLVGVEEGGGVDVCLPLVGGELTHVGGGAAGQANRSRKAVDQHVVPLVKYCDSPVAIGQTCQSEGAIGVALRECEVLGVRIAKAHVALGERKAIVRTAAVKPLIRSSAHALGRDYAGYAVGAVFSGDERVGAMRTRPPCGR